MLKFTTLVLAWWHLPSSQLEEFRGDIQGTFFEGVRNFSVKS